MVQILTHQTFTEHHGFSNDPERLWAIALAFVWVVGSAAVRKWKTLALAVHRVDMVLLQLLDSLHVLRQKTPEPVLSLNVAS